MQPKDIAKEADFLFLMLGYPHDVRNMVLDEKDGILNHMKAGSVLIDHTTSSPELAEQIAVHSSARQVESVDAPVSGGDIGAKNGNLVTMVGGTEEGVGKVNELLEIYSQQVEHMGKPGAGQHTKAANQVMIATTMVGVCEALLYGQKAGLNHEQMINLLSKGGAGSF